MGLSNTRFRAIEANLLAALVGVGLGHLSFHFGKSQYGDDSDGSAKPVSKNAIKLQNTPSRTPLLRDETLRRIAFFREHPNAHHRLLLNEVLAVYYRTNPIDCIAVLKELRASALLESVFPPIGPLPGGSLGTALQTASQLDSGPIADSIVTDAFRAEMKMNPGKAFALMPQLPPHLRFELSRELARSWGQRDGFSAASAFYQALEQSPEKRSELMTPFVEGLSAWGGQGDPNLPITFLNEIAGKGKGLIPMLRSQYLQNLSIGHPSMMAKLATSDASERSDSSSRLMALMNLAGKAPDEALAQVEAMTEPDIKVRGLLVVASELSSKDTRRTQAILERLPPSTQSNQVMQKLASSVAAKE